MKDWDAEKKVYWDALDSESREAHIANARYPGNSSAKDRKHLIGQAMDDAWQDAEKPAEWYIEAREDRARQEAEQEAIRTRALTCTECGADVTADTSLQSGVNYIDGKETLAYVGCADCLRKDGVAEKFITWEETA